MNPLPIDSVIPQIHSALETAPVVIIQAPPGSGKSTRIPLSLLGQSWLADNKVLMLEPRRLAAINLAAWLAAGLGEKTGGTVGYTIRFERKTSPRTRLEILTEGILTRRLQSDQFLESVGAVIFDEFHERSIHSDTALAFCLYLQRTVRPDLKILIMSATLETRSIADLIPEAAIVNCEGRRYPVAVRYLGLLDADPALSAAKAAAIAIRECHGDILVFLPGAGEIRRCLATLRQRYSAGELLILPLYGDVPLADQEKALTPADRRKIVLATNIAETSLTIEGITVVIDCGLTRRARFDPSRGFDSLVTEKISRASAEQRAGRSGRTAPGVCYRLWSESQQNALLPFDPPEILVADLCGLALQLAQWGVQDPAGLSFPDQPPAATLREAQRSLQLLGALDNQGRITPCGKRLAELPLHPRIATLLLAAVDEDNGCLGADIAAILTERDFVRSTPQATLSASDLADRLEILSQWRRYPGSVATHDGLDVGTLRRIDRLSSQLRAIIHIHAVDYLPDVARVSRLAALAFPDRIARQREPGSRRYLLANGCGALLDARSGMLNQEYLVALRMDGGGGAEGRIFTATGLDPAQLKKEFSSLITTRRTASWDSALRRVTVREEELLGAITLQSRVVKAAVADVLAAVSERLQSTADHGLFLTSPVSDQFQARVKLIRELFPEDDWPDLSTQRLLQTAPEWFPGLIVSQEKPEKLSGIELEKLFRTMLGWKKEHELDRLAPLTITVPSGSKVKVDYTAAGGPAIAVKLQELFGLRVTPAICAGRVPLLIQLLSPAGRPMQITRDLRSFWDHGYPLVKKELKGRYPKHPWPDDPWSALPTKLLTKHLQK
jgi:ATP-dependent helicase HrpB